MNPDPAPDRPLTSKVIKRGLQIRCPSCGQGRVLAGYLKPAPNCTACGEDFTNIRADDGPAWATIILVGHLISPAFMLFATPDDNARLVGLLVILTLILSMTFFLLPRMKGLFIGLIWRNRAGEVRLEQTNPDETA